MYDFDGKRGSSGKGKIKIKRKARKHRKQKAVQRNVIVYFPAKNHKHKCRLESLEGKKS
jgi:hypothetical protein